MGQFLTKKQQPQQSQNMLADVPGCASDTLVVEGSFCIYNYTYMFILRTQEDVTQIGVDLIKKVQGNPCSSEARFHLEYNTQQTQHSTLTMKLILSTSKAAKVTAKVKYKQAKEC